MFASRAELEAERDAGFTLVEIVVAVILVGLLSAVAVVGVGRMTSQGASAGCTASADAARAAAAAHFGVTGMQPSSFADLFASDTLEPAPSVTATADGNALVGPGWSLLSYPVPGGPPRLVCSTATLGATGLAATMFGTTTFTSPVASYTHTTPANQNWGYSIPYPGMGDGFSVRYIGTIAIPSSGTWTFTGTADNQIALWVNDQQVLSTAGTNRIALSAGVFPIRIDFVEISHAAAWSITWTPPGGSAVTIPASAFTAGSAPTFSTNPGAPALTSTALTATTASFSVEPSPTQPKVVGTATVALSCSAPGQATRTSTATTWLLAVDNLTTGVTYTCTATVDDSPVSAPMSVTPVAAPVANGLAGIVYNTSTFTNPIATFVHTSSSSSQWNYGSPHPGMVDTFSIRYAGVVTVPTTGSWGFDISADNVLTVWIDGVQILTGSSGSTTTNLTAGTHSIRIDFRETGAAAGWRLRWTPPGGSASEVPSTALSTV